MRPLGSYAFFSLFAALRGSGLYPLITVEGLIIAEAIRHLTEEDLALIKRFDGLVSEVYICPAGSPTIGYGHVVRDHESARFSDGIDQTTAEVLLRRDLGTAECAVLRLIRVPLADDRFDALASFAFNLGAGAQNRRAAPVPEQPNRFTVAVDRPAASRTAIDEPGRTPRQMLYPFLPASAFSCRLSAHELLPIARRTHAS